jgi:hypothetical protein
MALGTPALQALQACISGDEAQVERDAKVVLNSKAEQGLSTQIPE